MGKTNVAAIPASDSGGVPSGCILLWSGAVNTVPDGWALCDGQNGTPDLRDRFVVGAGGGYAVGATGGEASHALTTAEMPSHNHSFSGNATSAGAHTHKVQYEGYGVRDLYGGGTKYSGSDTAEWASGGSLEAISAGAHTHTVSGTIGSRGSGAAHENRPPYYALAYIMKI